MLKKLFPGDPAPWFEAPTSSNPRFVFNSVAGHYICLVFIRSSDSEEGAKAIAAIAEKRALFDDDKVALFGVTADASDQLGGKLSDQPPGLRWFYDPEDRVAELYGMAGEGEAPQEGWLVLDPSLRVIGAAPLSQIGMMFDYVARLPPVDAHAGVPLNAPVLIAPRIFEPEFCKRLMAYYDEKGGNESGFMREIDGKTVPVHDHKHKRRKDALIEDEELVTQCRVRIVRRLVPEVAKAFQFTATRMERYLVACYTGEDKGHFRAHRDNTTKGTAHRKFAVSINLNAEDYEGGELKFPEFGNRLYKPPTGGAVVFSCSLLHEARPVTKGTRFVFVPFLYDEASAKLREANLEFVDRSIQNYKADPKAKAEAEPAGEAAGL